MNKEMIESLKKLENIQVVAVSKMHTKEEVDAVAKEGLTTFGENKVQEFLEKYDSNYKWHIIGHLQTNKVKYIVGKADVIESLDSLKLAKEIEKQAKKHDVIQECYVQIKISKDENKTGLPIEEAILFLKDCEELSHIKITGLMCVASNTDDENLIINEFDQMHELFDLTQKMYPEMKYLSMGMSDDYELAIAHGSNTIRIGSSIFGKRNYHKVGDRL
ncbi:YggS family pyridoxal phosphate-dependent enzyme [Floccifex sp.]|uniref:YggS family pyridoxal phosphate-dependent enzyme n=1 Tax=Floccifex sp. TaxID=2815810 RepID=UPI003F0650F1